LSSSCEYDILILCISFRKSFFRLSKEKQLGELTLRQIAGLVGETSPQKIKHHLQQLELKGLVRVDRAQRTIERTLPGWAEGLLKKPARLLSIPIVGSANCGPAELLADQNLEGYLRVSSTLVGSHRSSSRLFAIRAVGSSMNKTSVDGKPIEEGDYLIVDGEDVVPENGNVILSIIDGAANVKKYSFDKKHKQITLFSESTHAIPPILIHPDDNYLINGKVIQVIKNE
jgi:SOS-response transcriptional repressor LexA